MAISDAIAEYMHETGLKQREIAEQLHFDRSMVSKIISGERKWPEAHDAQLAGLSWKLALVIADERTGGYISNILDDIPNLDLHPAALKDVLLKELQEAENALEELILAKHIDPKKRKEAAERVWNEIRDVMEKGLVLQGVIEEEFGLDRDRLIKKHELEVKEGKR
jgi:transcriptional regulator with XRE-family HTH domain